VYVGTILFGKFLVTTDGNLSLSFSTIVIRCLLNIFMIYVNGTFCTALRMSGIASLFIDMHGAIDLLNFKYGNVASTRGARKCAVWQWFVRQCDY